MRSARFWVPMLLFQVVIGLAIFAVTRYYYLHGTATKATEAPAVPNAVQDPVRAWVDRATASGPAVPAPTVTGPPAFAPPASGPAVAGDPAEIARQADRSFADEQYDRAAELYAQLLTLSPHDVETYNNLGLTLHYLGRSTEALDKLNAGIAIDPTYQRIWLTSGFVNRQVGNIEAARAALTKAVQMDPGSDVGRSAANMLAALPEG